MFLLATIFVHVSYIHTRRAEESAVDSSAVAEATDWKAVEQALGKAGSMQPGDVYKDSLPRSDLKVTVDGVEVKPALALGSWLAFKKIGDMTMVMRDLVYQLGIPRAEKIMDNGMERKKLDVY